MSPELGRSSTQAAVAFSNHMNMRDRHIDFLKSASALIEKSQGFTSGIKEILNLLRDKCGLVDSRMTLLESAACGSTQMQIFSDSYEANPSQSRPFFGQKEVDEAVLAAEQFVSSHGRYKMVPVVSSSAINFRSSFKIQRGAKLYVLSLPIKLGEQKLGILSAVKLCYGSFDPKAELDFLSVLCVLIAQSALINRFYPDAEKALGNLKAVEFQRRQDFDRSGMIGNSKPMQRVFSLLEQVSSSDTPILITGESGVGKELIAHAIHRNSPRHDHPFIKVNCAAFEGDHEEELFGIEASEEDSGGKIRVGQLEKAAGGTIFLDEISALPVAVQVKLLRLLQDQEFQKVGSSEIQKVDVRVIVATDRKLQNLVDEQKFRQDLYYRLNVFPIHVPALRERKTDIIPITDYFVEKYRKIHHKNIRRISTPAIDLLSSYHWPGNIRELENCIERAVILTNEGVIRGHHLPPSLQMADAIASSAEDNHLQTILDSMEKELILDAIKESRGNMAKAARELGLTERVMGLRTKKYSIDSKKYRKHSNGC